MVYLKNDTIFLRYPVEMALKEAYCWGSTGSDAPVNNSDSGGAPLNVHHLNIKLTL